MNSPPSVTILLARLQAIEYFDQSVVVATRVDCAVRDQAVVLNDPDVRRIAFVDDGRLRHCRRLGRVAGQDSEIREHLWLERAVSIVDLRADRQPVGHGIDYGGDVLTCALKTRFG